MRVCGGKEGVGREGVRWHGCVVRVVYVVCVVCAVCDVGVWVWVWGEGGPGEEGGGRKEGEGVAEAKAILGDGGIRNAGEGGGLWTRVVLACPTCLQVLGVFTPVALAASLSHVFCRRASSEKHHS